MNLLEQIEAAARKISDAVEGRTCGRVGVDVTVVAGKLTTVQFTASVGNVCGNGKDLYRVEFGESVDMATDALLNTITRDNINRSIRVKYLEDMANELGFEIKKKRGDK